MNWLFAVLTVYLYGVATPCCEKSKFRLNGNVRPKFYSINIQPDIDNKNFTGEVLMHIDIDVAVDSVDFHINSTYLTIERVFFDTEEVKHVEKSCELSSGSFGYEFIPFELVRIVRGENQSLPPGAHVLQIKYHGQFSESTEGIFKASCTKNGTRADFLIATDFQPSYARRVFPCFDEPGFKANFQLTLTVPDGSYVALSNTRADDVSVTSNGVVYRFETTPPMSTYLLTFAITRHSYKEYLKGNLTYRLYSAWAEEDNTILLEYSNDVIDFYTNYLDVDYALSKLDFIGFDRYETSATENWGLVTFNTSLLSPYDDFYGIYQKKSVIAHELAHFWFGNLVTNQWWDDIWLQESFATFMSLKAEEALLGNNASNHFPLVYQENLFYMEQSKFTKPIVNFQEEPTDIRNNFNDVTYIKGTAVLRMLELAIGEQKLHEVLKEYIKSFSFETATTRDFLWIATNHWKNYKVREFMESYLYQNKFPVIEVQEEEEAFVLRQINVFNTSFGHKWTIPVTYITDLTSSELVWFYKDMDSLTLPKKGALWIKLNIQQIGYYRVLYSDVLWEKFIENSQKIDPYERDHLLSESTALYTMNLFSCETVLKYLWALSNVTNRSDFNLEYAYSAYINIHDDIKKYDHLASCYLKTFFGHVFKRVGMKSLSKRFTSPCFPSSQITRQSTTGKIQECILWLKTKSPEIYKDL